MSHPVKSTKASILRKEGSLAAAQLFLNAAILAALAGPAFGQEAQKPPAGCDAGNGGITLSPGFCASVFADKLGHARHMAIAADGTLYVNTWSGRYY
ncbi:MAG: hypothetical protein ACLPJW_14965, partial [Rhodomicrobium sp.]